MKNLTSTITTRPIKLAFDLGFLCSQPQAIRNITSPNENGFFILPLVVGNHGKHCVTRYFSVAFQSPHVLAEWFGNALSTMTVALTEFRSTIGKVAHKYYI